MTPRGRFSECPAPPSCPRPVEYKPTVKQKLEGYFEKKYHSDVPTLIDQGKLAEHEIEAFALLSDNPKNIPLSEALEFYLSEHKNKDNHLFCTRARLDLPSRLSVTSPL